MWLFSRNNYLSIYKYFWIIVVFQYVSAFYCVIHVYIKFECLLHWHTLADETHLLALRLSGSNLRRLEVIYSAFHCRPSNSNSSVRILIRFVRLKVWKFDLISNMSNKICWRVCYALFCCGNIMIPEWIHMHVYACCHQDCVYISQHLPLLTGTDNFVSGPQLGLSSSHEYRVQYFQSCFMFAFLNLKYLAHTESNQYSGS